MPQRYQRMPHHHSRPGIAHYLPHLFAFLFTKAMHLAVVTIGFVGLKAALINAHKGKCAQLFAIHAVFAVVMIAAAIHIYHQANHFFFSGYTVHRLRF
jgi:hypothetical protein